ncbi:MAG: hypothetical protein ACFFBD_03935 [Candidatus Hodarchaeota archaeon]
MPTSIVYIKKRNSSIELKDFDLADADLSYAFNFFINRKEYIVTDHKENQVLDIVYTGPRPYLASLGAKAKLKFNEIHSSDIPNSPSSLKVIMEFRYRLLGEISIYLAFIFLYLILNIMNWLLNRSTILPFRVTDPAQFLTFLPLLGVLMIIYLATDYFPNNNKSILTRIIDNLSTSLKEIVVQSTLEKKRSYEFERELRYIRVLWNQAKKQYKERSYNMFVIKGDAAVRKLLGVRYNQFYEENEEKEEKELNFQNLTEDIRKLGFDIPNNKRIKFFRQLRNVIVHSSRNLTEEEAEKAFQHYSKFIERLGLRP